MSVPPADPSANPGTPLVSVITPTWNRAHVIGESVESVLAQTYARWELIVVDDGSTDDTEAALAPYRDRLTYVRTANGGPGAARNAGFRHARGEVIAMLDSDDVWAPGKLSLQMAVLDRHPDVVLVSSDFWAFDAERRIEDAHLGTYYSLPGRLPRGFDSIFSGRETVGAAGVAETNVYLGDVREMVVMGSWLHPSTVLMRREAMEATGDLDASLENLHEYEYFVRLAHHGPFAHVDRSLAGYRYSPGQLSSDENLLSFRRAILEIVGRVAERDPGGEMACSPAYRRRLAECHLGLARAAVREQQRGVAARHLWESLRRGLVGVDSLRVVAKAILPSTVADLLRRDRGGAGTG